MGRKYLLNRKGMFWGVLFLISVNSTFAIAVAFLLKFVIDAASAQNQGALNQAIVFCIVYVVLYFGLFFVTGVIKAKYKEKIMIALRNDIFKSVMRFDIATFSKTNTADYISILNNDVKVIEENFFKNFWDYYQNILMLVFALVSMFFVSPYVAMIAVLMSLLPLAIPSLFGKKLAALQKEYMHTLEKYNGKIKDFFTGFEVLKSFGVESRAADNHALISVESEQSKYLLEKMTAFVTTFGVAVSLCVQFSIFIISGYFVVHGHLTVGSIVAITQLSGNVVAPLMNLTQCHAKFKAVSVVNNKILNLMKTKETAEIRHQPVRFNKSITCENISFSYGERNILNDISFTFEKGKKYAIVGRSGSGKSTLLQLLLGYYDNYTGNFLIDGENKKEIGENVIQQMCSVIHQEVFVFDDTIKNNITLYNDYDDKTIQEAMRRAGLASLVDESTEGMNTAMGEDGKCFSGGEKQRIAIARALIKNDELLIMDEATAHLDNETAYHIEKTLLEIETLTSIVVTHRFNSHLLSMYDQIIVLKNGQLHETGTLSELLANKGYFYSLYHVSNE